MLLVPGQYFLSISKLLYWQSLVCDLGVGFPQYLILSLVPCLSLSVSLHRPQGCQVVHWVTDRSQQASENILLHSFNLHDEAAAKSHMFYDTNITRWLCKIISYTLLKLKNYMGILFKNNSFIMVLYLTKFLPGKFFENRLNRVFLYRVRNKFILALYLTDISYFHTFVIVVRLQNMA